MLDRADLCANAVLAQPRGHWRPVEMIGYLMHKFLVFAMHFAQKLFAPIENIYVI